MSHSTSPARSRLVLAALVALAAGPATSRAGVPADTLSDATASRAGAPADTLSVTVGPVLGIDAKGEPFLSRPAGISLDHKGRLFVADAGNDRIVLFGAAGVVEAEFGRSGSDDGRFLEPTDVAAREGFFYYVSDSENERVPKFDRFRTFVENVVARGGLEGAFGTPRGVEVDDDGRLYVADTEADRVWILDAFSGEPVTSLGGFGAAPGRFQDPLDVAIDPERRILVADAGNRRVQIFDRLGNFVAVFGDSAGNGPPLGRPTGIACHPAGFTFVCDPPSRRVAVYDPAGRFLSEIRDERFAAPASVTTDGDSLLFVSDAGADRVFSFRLNAAGGAGGAGED